ncbi:MAG: FAD-dependent oxidoreductase [Sporichthyaceae bacterium]
MARSHAVVVGAGISGLLAARVLADFYEHVTLVERDEFPRRGEPRAGTAQAAQWHLFMPSASAIMEELNPGLLADLAAAGTPVLGQLSQTRLDVGGHLLATGAPLPADWYLPTRPLLEAHLRARVSERVLMRPGATVIDLVADDGRVTGLVLATADGPERLYADLVVDASGGALQPAAGLPYPERQSIEIDVRQVTVTLVPAEIPDEVVPVLLDGPHLTRPSGLAVSRVEGGKWQLTCLGYSGNQPPTDRAGLLAFVEAILPAPWFRMVSTAEWSHPAVFDFPASVWCRYDELADPPTGLLTIGDGLYRQNPVHSKGMTTAAREALLLRDCLAKGDGDLPRRWYAETGKLLAGEWALTEGVDRLCAAPPEDPELLAKMDKLMHKILTVAESDPEVVQNLLRVQWGLAQPVALFSPGLVRKLVGGKFRFGRRSREAVAS